MLKTYKLELTLEELLPIDGKVSEKTQEIINKAKQESTYGFELPVMNEVLRKSEKLGSFTWRFKQIRSCNYCDKKYDYHEYPRSGRYHKKGDKNHNKPIYYSGIAFNEGFVTFQGQGDICSECASKHNVIYRLIDYILDNDLKVEIQKNDYRFTKYLKDDIRICYECGNEMQESKMGKHSTLMGDGTYPSSCPACGAESLPFGRSHKITNKFVMIKNPTFKSEILLNELKNEIEQYNKNNNIKIKVFEVYNKRNEFLIWTEESNHQEIVSFNVIKKTYKKEWNFEKQYQFLINILEKYNYKI